MEASKNLIPDPENFIKNLVNQNKLYNLNAEDVGTTNGKQTYRLSEKDQMYQGHFSYRNYWTVDNTFISFEVKSDGIKNIGVHNATAPNESTAKIIDLLSGIVNSEDIKIKELADGWFDITVYYPGDPNYFDIGIYDAPENKNEDDAFLLRNLRVTETIQTVDPVKPIEPVPTEPIVNTKKLRDLVGEVKFILDEVLIEIGEIEKPEPEPTPEPIPIEPETPEKPIDPEPTIPTKREIINVDVSENIDNTAALRATFDKDNTVYKFPKDVKVFAIGMLNTDPLNSEGLNLAQHGIIKISEKKNIEIDGQNATIWNEIGAVPVSYPEGHEKFGQKYPISGLTMSKRKFIRIERSSNVWIHDIKVESGNLVPTSKPGRPDYNVIWEFEHGINIGGSHQVAIENFYVRGVWGDGSYIINSKDVYLRNVTIDWNGRQGGALISGERGYLERYNVLNSRRSGYDIEGNYVTNEADGFVITYSKFQQHLTGLPMGGRGFVKNVLCINNHYANATLYCQANDNTKFRENIMFVNCKGRNLGQYMYTKNILVDGIEQDGIQNNSLVLSTFRHCSNITIRNCDINSYGFRWKGSEPFFLIGAEGVDPSEFKIYNNKQKIGIVDKSKAIRADQVEIGKWYWKVEGVKGNTNFQEIDPNRRADYYEIFMPVKKPTEKDFKFIAEFSTMEDVKATELTNGKMYKIGDSVYEYNINSTEQFKKMTLEDLEMVVEVVFPKEYFPTPEEAISIPFETNNEWIDMQWKRLYGKSWREELYEDDGWRPEWYNNLTGNK